MRGALRVFAVNYSATEGDMYSRAPLPCLAVKTISAIVAL